MNVLFIYPNRYSEGYIPVGLALLSAILKRNGHNTSLFDTSFFNVGLETNRTIGEKYLQFKKVETATISPAKKEADIYVELKNQLNDFNPDLIAATCTSNDYDFLKQLLGFIKKQKEIPVILGGPHATVSAESVIREESIDMVCIGEGDEAFPELCNKLQKKEEITGIRNIWVKANNKIYRNQVRPLLKDLDSLPFVDWEIFDEQHHYRPFSGKMYYFGWFEFGRGCPFACNYCINPFLHNLYNGETRFYRAKSPKRCIEELKYLKQKYPLQFIRFVDETFLAMPVNYLRDFAKLYKKEINLPFIIATRVETVVQEKIDILQDMGTCKHVSIGVESGSERIRKEICNRHMSNQTIIKATHLLHQAGIKITTFNMIGFPTETRKEVFQTIELNRQINPDVAVTGFFCPYEGTPLRSMCIEKGLISNDGELINYTAGTMLEMPLLSSKMLSRLKKTFNLYIKSPKILFPLIYCCEYDNPVSNFIYTVFVKYYSSKL